MKGQTKYSIVIQNMNHAIKKTAQSPSPYLWGIGYSYFIYYKNTKMLKPSYKTVVSMCV